jgi:hypothetical protein
MKSFDFSIDFRRMLVQRIQHCWYPSLCHGYFLCRFAGLSQVEGLTLTGIHAIIHIQRKLKARYWRIMMKRLRGRNLKHPGCLIGITAGLTFGIALAGLLAYFANVSYNVVVLLWLGLTLGLGVLGWVIGDRMTAKFPPLEETDEAISSELPPAQS